MASDRQQFKAAERHWEQLRTDQCFSVPEHLGKTAIICSYFNNVEFDDDEDPESDDIVIFRNEAYALADATLYQGGEPEVILNATSQNILETLADPSFSNIITIGHGNLSELFVGNEDGDDGFDWRQLSDASDHLKTGKFIQRHCGSYTRCLSVPLGTFAMADHRNVIAPVGRYFNPTSLEHHDNAFLIPVSPSRKISYEFIKTRFVAPNDEPKTSES